MNYGKVVDTSLSIRSRLVLAVCQRHRPAWLPLDCASVGHTDSLPRTARLRPSRVRDKHPQNWLKTVKIVADAITLYSIHFNIVHYLQRLYDRLYFPCLRASE